MILESKMNNPGSLEGNRLVLIREYIDNMISLEISPSNEFLDAIAYECMVEWTNIVYGAENEQRNVQRICNKDSTSYRSVVRDACDLRLFDFRSTDIRKSKAALWNFKATLPD